MSDQKPIMETTLPISRERIPFPLTIDTDRAAAEFASAQVQFDLEDKKVPTIFYREALSPETTYLIYRYEQRWEFQLIHQEEKIAEFIFDQEEDGLHMRHRLVRDESKKMGINGSAFLKKAESYIRFLAQQKTVDSTKPLLIDAGQKEVIQWALKNGFAFPSKKSQRLFEEATQSGSSKYQIDVDEGVPTNEGIFRRGYIMRRDVYKKWKRLNDDLAAEGKELMPAGRASMRFQLEKSLKS